MAPQLQDLPQAPVAPKVVGATTSKENGGGGEASASSTDVLLQALMQHVGTDSLPANLQTIVGTYQETNVRAEAKKLHGLVSQQSNARKELQRLKHDRLQYEESWSSCVDKVAETFGAQVEEHTEILNQFEAAEAELVTQLEQTAQALQESTSMKAKEETRDAAEAMETEVDAVTAAKDLQRARIRRQDQEAKEQSLQQALVAAREANKEASIALAAQATKTRSGGPGVGFPHRRAVRPSMSSRSSLRGRPAESQAPCDALGRQFGGGFC